MNIGIIGNGYVGSATSLLLPSAVEQIIYDIDPDKSSPKGTTFDDLGCCDLIFICIPTPMTYNTGAAYTKDVEDLAWRIHRKLQDGVHTAKPYIVIRSTVPPGTSRRVDANFMPEFLTEKNWEDDIKNTSSWIVGANDIGDDDFKGYMQSILDLSLKEGKIKGANINFVDPPVAEMAKYMSNTFFATKVAFFNEMYEFCEFRGIPFEEVRRAFLDSSRGRVAESHTSVPGPDGHRGFGGTCLPKDLSAIIKDAHKLGIPLPLLSSVKLRNENRDRPEKDWFTNEQKGRVFK